MDGPDLRRMLRKIEWQRARGHLEAMLETYDGDDEEELERVNEVVIDLEKWMEDEL